jgi:hypothetical protein
MEGPKTRLKRPVVGDPNQELRNWLTLLDELVTNVRDWVGEDWSTELIHKSMNDSVLGSYKAPGLRMQRDFTRAILEPIARFAPGTDGVVDLAKIPAYDQIASLYRIDGEWKLHFAFRGSNSVASVRSADSLAWNEANLRRVLEEFDGHAA